MTESNEWLDVKQAAEYLGIGMEPCRRLIKRHEQSLVNYTRTVSSRGRKGNKLFINQQGLVILANCKNIKSKSTTVVEIAKQQLAETAIMASELMKDPIIAIRVDQIQMNKRLESVEQRVARVELEKAQAEEQLLQLPLPNIAPKEISMRNLIRRVINQYADLKRIPYSEVWTKLYKELYYRCQVNVQDRVKNSNGTKNGLDILEEQGLLEQAYALAVELFNKLHETPRT